MGLVAAVMVVNLPLVMSVAIAIMGVVAVVGVKAAEAEGKVG